MKTEFKKSEKGNVLFLILIAVALFAALSYVVTQSTRSGGGSTEREKNILSSAQMTQYPTALRTSVMRMILGGVSVENLRFDIPGSAAFNTTSSSQLVFHPQGGGATYQDGPADLSATGNAGLVWYYNANFDVPGIGIDGVAGNDLIAFLPNVSQGICRQVNEELSVTPTGTCTGSTNLPNIDASVVLASTDDQMDTTYGAFPTTDQVNLQGSPTASCTVFTRQASGCFYQAANTRYVFYSVILER